MTLVVLSPHLDDAVLCAGGLMSRARAEGMRVTMLTVFAGDPPPGALGSLARAFHADCDLSHDAVAVRRAEDAAAAAALDVEASWLDFPDAIYRCQARRPTYTSRRELFGRPAFADGVLCDQAVGSILARGRDVEAIMIPLSVGGHVDHRLTRRIGEAVVDVVRPRFVGWYEESAYEAQMGSEAWAEVDRAGLMPHDLKLSADQWALKRRAVESYPSQIRMLGVDGASPTDQAIFHDHLRVERLWHSTKAAPGKWIL